MRRDGAVPSAGGGEAFADHSFGADGLGRVEFMASGQLTELVARRAPDFAHAPVNTFERCMIDQVVDGTALVSPLALPSATDSHG